MLLETYRLEIFNSRCNPGAMAVHCFAHLDQDVSAALPYLNAVLGGFNYVKDPPSVTFRSQGKLITVHGNKIAINALKDEAEAGKIVEWLKREINEAWEKRDEIEPSYESQPRPQVFEVLKMLPENQLPGMRGTDLYGLCRGRYRRGKRCGRLPAAERRGEGKTTGII